MTATAQQKQHHRQPQRRPRLDLHHLHPKHQVRIGPAPIVSARAMGQPSPYSLLSTYAARNAYLAYHTENFKPSHFAGILTAATPRSGIRATGDEDANAMVASDQPLVLKGTHGTPHDSVTQAVLPFELRRRR